MAPRVLLIAQYFDRPEAHIFSALAERGIDIEVLCDRNSPFTDILAQKVNKLDYVSLSSRLSPEAIRTIKTRVRSKHFDIIHTLSARALSNALWATRKSQAKHITYRGTTGHISRWDPAAWMSFLNPRVDKIVCVSQAVENWLSTCGIAPSKLVTIYKGHDVAWYEKKAALTRAQIGLPEDAIVVGCIANFRPVKGGDLLLEASAQLTSDRQLHFVLVGENRDPNILKVMKRHPHPQQIHLLGYQANASDYAQLFDFQVIPSRDREGLPKAAIEAMAQGIACIVSNAGGLPELVEHERSGLVVERGNSSALSAAIARLVADPQMRKNIGQAGRERIRTEFCLERSVQRIYELYLGQLNPTISID